MTMHKGIVCLLLATGASAALASGSAPASYLGTYSSWGRACKGEAVIRTKTAAWRSAWSQCESSPYEVLNVAKPGELRRLVLKLKKRSKSCLYEIIEVEEREAGGVWSLSGYASMAAYDHRDDPEWRYSDRPDRFILSCPLDGRP
mgnify:FL=1